ncbi:vacuolar protein sorting-associated protein 9A-like isoform X1 [Cynara cardunculus var. scolymus]|uniref:Vacuolar sorting protein 9 n=1 Tax=Cynara cardunculus var. scolymus TaxID=59895 RepID=A0A103YD43_CYNCS|nr:vacuolar protein sorting-associated protein 9A-like isoform X1 [Cynara cardunculus var. scolymus]XP_024971097.1 vacuolar protein sorting-associated protein 9A-like isoform X1 [Cynara cardunculus var. scolymus]KVI06894.1 Vacuolar sorting protein 9 [Cynara cardunculus var. scolymus]
MENSEASISSTATRTWHDFLERMRQPSATEFVKSIKSFIVSFSNNAPDPERDSASIQEFLGNMEAAFRAHPLWAGRTEEELDNAGEGLEKYIMTKLFNRVFASHPDDIKIDNELHQKSALIQQFIRPEHLEIRQIYENETSWLLAQKELQKINVYKSPRDKLACILNCCKIISNLLLNAAINANQNPPGADDFLPVLIYITIKANPPQLHSNLSYIQRYRCKSRLVGESAYIFTNMLSAESFILSINAESLSMNETEFTKNMESAQLISGLSSETQSETVSNSKLKEVPSVSDLENKGAAVIVAEENVSEKFDNFPYLYSKAEDLTIGNVEELLNGYKQLVFKYVCLAKGLGVPVWWHQAQGTRTGGEAAGDLGKIDGDEEGLGVPARLSAEIGGGSGVALEGKESMELNGDDVGGGKELGGPEPPLESSEAGIAVHSPEAKGDVVVDDEQKVEDVRVEGGRNDESTVAGKYMER